jgi:hypothetical protein
MPQYQLIDDETRLQHSRRSKRKNMNRFAASALFLVMSNAAQAAVAEDGHVALFKNVTGTMRIVRQDQAIDAVPGMTLFVTDRIVSGANSTAGIVFKDGTLVTLGASSELQIRDYAFETQDSKYQFAMYLAKGSAIYSSGKIGKLAPESVKIDTPTTTVGVRGTRFIITAD